MVVVDKPAIVCIHSVCVRIVKEKFLFDVAVRHPKAAKYLAAWTKTVRAVAWRNLAEVRHSYPSADLVRVGSGKPVIVFNVCGNTYRLIVAIHFSSQMAYTLRFLTHADYDREEWKDEL
jgi:mRNA interferase HigB